MYIQYFCLLTTSDSTVTAVADVLLHNAVLELSHIRNVIFMNLCVHWTQHCKFALWAVDVYFWFHSDIGVLKLFVIYVYFVMWSNIIWMLSSRLLIISKNIAVSFVYWLVVKGTRVLCYLLVIGFWCKEWWKLEAEWGAVSFSCCSKYFWDV